MAPLDWLIILTSLAFTLGVGIAATRRASSSTAEFFLAGRTMPWWLLGLSMVATTFSAGTPNFVTDLVRQKGVAGNWVWWAFLPTGMMTVFLYAKLWRRSGVMTDIEFYELRYSGRPAALLRGFRAVYLGLVFNVIVMASATLAAIKIAGVMLGATPLQTILAAGAITVVYTMLGGLTGVLWTDFVQFLVAMGGAIAAAAWLVARPEIGGLSGLLAHPAVQQRTSLFPDFQNLDLALSVFIIPLAVQWWSVWYPGSEPGGGGYIAQRMLAAKNELHATGATLLFNACHYALRPWPWIIVALCSLVIYPDLDSLRAGFGSVGQHQIKDDLAYPAMMTLLPQGLRGVVFASLLAAYMSTLSTHLNLGSSYLVHDFYRRFYRPDAGEKELVGAARLVTLLTMALSSLLALWLSSALQAFEIILQIGAGTGLLFILRWFWWRINAASEITAMAVSFLVALGLQSLPITADWPSWLKIVVGVAITTVAWLGVALLAPPDDDATLRRFYRQIRPGGPGWRAVVRRASGAGEHLPDPAAWSVPVEILCSLVGCVAVYAAILATGYLLYENWAPGMILAGLAAAATWFLLRTWRRVGQSAGNGEEGGRGAL